MSKKRENLQAERISALKVKFLEYFKELPIQKLAASYIGRGEDTIVAWKKLDPNFSDQIDALKAEWALKQVNKVKSREWLLERIMKDHFAPKQEIGGIGDQPIQIIVKRE